MTKDSQNQLCTERGGRGVRLMDDTEPRINKGKAPLEMINWIEICPGKQNSKSVHKSIIQSSVTLELKTGKWIGF